MGEPPLVVAPHTPIREVVASLREDGRTAAVVAETEGDDEHAGVRLLGILTEEDVVRRVAFQADPGAPVADFMTSPMEVVGADDYLYTAIARMRLQGLRHMPAVDEYGRAVGMLRLPEAYAAAAVGMLEHLDALTSDGSIAGMRAVRHAQVALAEELFEDNLPAPEIQRVITHLNNDMARRITGMNIAAIGREGKGPPPVPFAMIIMGSGGRGENFFHPDQDNGFVLEDYAASEHEEIDAWFVDLAERVTRDLDGVGIPYCRGNVMATNPLWRKPLGQWKEQTTHWADDRTPQSIRNADIFFDFRWLYGERHLVASLREHVSEISAANQRFLYQLMRDPDADKVALAWFNQLATDRRHAEHSGQVDLKHNGTMPLVQGVRLLALREGVARTATLDRIAALRERGALRDGRADDLRDAFVEITSLLMKTQLATIRAGGTPGNHVSPEGLSRRDHERLVRALKTVQTFRNALRYTLTSGKV